MVQRQASYGAAFCALFACSSGAFAQDTGFFDDFDIGGDIGVTHDVRDRGLSISGFEFSPLARVDISTGGGLIAGVSSSLVDDLVGDVRVKAYAGYAFDAAGFGIDLSANLDSFYGGDVIQLVVDGGLVTFEDIDSRFFPEVELGVSRDFGLAYFRSSFVWAPEGRWSNDGGNSYYVSTNLEIPVPTLPALTVTTHVGFDILDAPSEFTVDGPTVFSDRFDWSAGLSYFWRDFEVTLQYVDSDAVSPFDDARVVAGLRFYF